MEHKPFPSWPDVAADLIATAAGRAPADTVVKGGRWVNVHSREVLPNHDVAIRHGRVACVVPDASYCTGPDTQVIEAEGRYILPGLCDGHMHIESGMLTPAEFARAVIPHGTTTMFTDPHEIANVAGLEGVGKPLVEGNDGYPLCAANVKNGAALSAAGARRAGTLLQAAAPTAEEDEG